MSARPRDKAIPLDHEHIALVLQGGGALGAYQAGVFDELSKIPHEPTWVAGISIGAINAALDFEFSRLTVNAHWRARQQDMRSTLSDPALLTRSSPDLGITVYDLARVAESRQEVGRPKSRSAAKS